MTYAPISLFVFNRIDLTKKTVEALLQNSEAKDSELFVFSDGPRAGKPEDLAKIAEVRNYIQKIHGFKSVTVTNREVNMGLAASIISGVSAMLENFESVIVLEDDLITSPFFLKFMNDGISRYSGDSRVCSIHGYVYPLQSKLNKPFFLRGADCWGWATWRTGWQCFNPDGKYLLEELERRNLTYSFNFEGSFNNTGMLEDQIAGRNNSWAIRWLASAYLANKLTLYPHESLVQNIGFDGSGTHCGVGNDYQVMLRNKPIDVTTRVSHSNKAFTAFKTYFQKLHGHSKNDSLASKIISILKRIRDCFRAPSQ